ncbi:MAG: ABC transporter permease [Brochothrix thermosphacta]|uniref:ABC transporter permease n=1 Tax=Brochothrix thermosphacta TaxID=2756 RepID=UPI000A1AF3F6|nr:ABC transporter, permease protein EscB [Brachybacterium faecium]
MANNLWKSRLADYFKDLSKYLRYIFNDHLVLVMVFVVGALGFYYSQWLKTLDASFPVNWVMIVVLVLVLSLTQVNTLLKSADAVYLTVMETRMASYFKKSIIFSFFFQLPLVIVAFIVLLPMYQQVKPFAGSYILMLLVYFILLKAWNVLMWWHVYKQPVRTVGILMQWLGNIVAVSIVFLIPQWWSLLIGVVLTIAILWMTMKMSKPYYIKWETLIVKEEARLNRFYRFANMFTDVPHLKNTTKKRAWLNWCYSGIALVQKNTYSYLWRRAFIRTDEFSGLFVRLTLIGLVIIYFMSNATMAILLVLLFSYLTGFQMLPMIRLYENHPMRELYPVPMKLYRSSFVTLLRGIMAVQAIIFAVIITIVFPLNTAAWMIAILVAFYLFFTFVYVPSKIKKLVLGF